MGLHLPERIVIFFVLTVITSLFLLVNATKKKLAALLVLLTWLIITGVLSYQGIFEDATAMPPRLLFIMLPALAAIILLLTTRPGKRFTDHFDISKLTWLHIIRIPVEIILYGLATYQLVPGLMTFAGRNYDLLSGITAPVMYFVCFRNAHVVKRKLLLVWNIVCLGLLLNIVINALLSAPFPFQLFAFDQPNIAILYFPFTWLPCFIVPIVLYSHIAVILRLTRKKLAH